MRMNGARNLAIWFLALFASATAQQVTVTIDPSVTYQTIDGMGLAQRAESWRYKSGPFYETLPLDRLADTLINTMGLTMVRGLHTKSCEFNPSPGEYVITAGLREEMRTDSALNQTAIASGEEFRYVPGVFSPPGWMKLNGQCVSGVGESTYPQDTQNALDPDHYDDFADLAATYIQICRDTFGLETYAFSPQNEPYFNQPYASCSYSGGLHYAQMLKVFGPAVEQANPATLIYGVEHMAHAYPMWENAVLGDAQANPYLHRFAVHGAVGPTDVDTAAFDQFRGDHERPLWLTELQWHDTSYTGSLAIARTVMKGLTSANMSGYLSGASLRTSTGEGLPNYALNAQYFRFVRPRMKRVEATSSDPLVMAGAFRDESKGSMSVVLLNSNSSSRTVTLDMASGSLPATFEEVRLTSSAERFVNQGSIAGNATITVPANGMVSLGHAHRGTASAVPRSEPQPTRAVATIPARALGRVFDLRGRLVYTPRRSPAGSGRHAAGMLFREASSTTGRMVERGAVAATVVLE